MRLCMLLLIRHAVLHDSTNWSSKCVGVRSLEHSCIRSRCLNGCRVAAVAAATQMSAKVDRNTCMLRICCMLFTQQLQHCLDHCLHCPLFTADRMQLPAAGVALAWAGVFSWRSKARSPLAAGGGASAKVMLGERFTMLYSRPWSWHLLVGSRHADGVGRYDVQGFGVVWGHPTFGMRLCPHTELLLPHKAQQCRAKTRNRQNENRSYLCIQQRASTRFLTFQSPQAVSIYELRPASTLC